MRREYYVVSIMKRTKSAEAYTQPCEGDVLRSVLSVKLDDSVVEGDLFCVNKR